MSVRAVQTSETGMAVYGAVGDDAPFLVEHVYPEESPAARLAYWQASMTLTDGHLFLGRWTTTHLIEPMP